jgi:hypothetical protein
MECTSCRANISNGKFCAECGAALHALGSFAATNVKSDDLVMTANDTLRRYRSLSPLNIILFIFPPRQFNAPAAYNHGDRSLRHQ